MPNPRLADRYAKSLVDLATERQQLEVVYKDMQYLSSVCKNSRDFINLLKSSRTYKTPRPIQMANA